MEYIEQLHSELFKSLLHSWKDGLMARWMQLKNKIVSWSSSVKGFPRLPHKRQEEAVREGHEGVFSSVLPLGRSRGTGDLSSTKSIFSCLFSISRWSNTPWELIGGSHTQYTVLPHQPEEPPEFITRSDLPVSKQVLHWIRFRDPQGRRG